MWVPIPDEGAHLSQFLLPWSAISVRSVFVRSKITCSSTERRQCSFRTIARCFGSYCSKSGRFGAPAGPKLSDKSACAAKVHLSASRYKSMSLETTWRSRPANNACEHRWAAKASDSTDCGSTKNFCIFLVTRICSSRKVLRDKCLPSCRRMASYSISSNSTASHIAIVEGTARRV